LFTDNLEDIEIKSRKDLGGRSKSSITTKFRRPFTPPPMSDSTQVSEEASIPPMISTSTKVPTKKLMNTPPGSDSTKKAMTRRSSKGNLQQNSEVKRDQMNSSETLSNTDESITSPRYDSIKSSSPRSFKISPRSEEERYGTRSSLFDSQSVLTFVPGKGISLQVKPQETTAAISVSSYSHSASALL
jgi:hypothetical protein